MNKKPIVEQITSAPEYKAFMAALEAQRKIGDAALGNGQVSLCAATAFRILAGQ